MISFGELEGQVRTLYEAESTTRWDSDTFLSAANEGLDELSEATLFYERNVSIALKGGQTYYDLREYVPKDAVSINSVFNPDQGIWLKPAGVRELGITSKWETVPGSPQRYLIRGLFWLGVYPRPSGDTGTIRVYFSGLAPHFKDSFSVLTEDLPDDFATALEEYMLYDLNSKDGEPTKALSHFSRYGELEDGLAAVVKDRITTARSGAFGRAP